MVGCVKISWPRVLLPIGVKHPEISQKLEAVSMGGLKQVFVLSPWPVRVSCILTNCRFRFANASRPHHSALH